MLDSNLLVNNSINGMMVRIRTSAGESLDQLTVSANLNAQNLVYVIPENLEIAGNPGGPVITNAAKATGQLLQAGSQQIETVGGSSTSDGDAFTITAGGIQQRFEFDGVSLSVLSGDNFSDGDTLTIGDSANPGVTWTFTFGTAAAAASNPTIIPFSVTDDPGEVADEIATTIENYAVASGDSTFVITAQVATYTESTDIVTGEEMPATVALNRLHRDAIVLVHALQFRPHAGPGHGGRPRGKGRLDPRSLYRGPFTGTDCPGDGRGDQQRRFHGHCGGPTRHHQDPGPW